MLKREEILKMFETAGAIRHGHFELTSGRHSGTYVQCALVLQYPRFAEKLGHALAELFSDVRVDAVVSPAMGGLIIGQEVARALPTPNSEPGGGVPAMFVERDARGMMTLRRGLKFARSNMSWWWKTFGLPAARRWKPFMLWKRPAGA